MIFTFDIAEDNSVKIFENGMCAIDQPLSPITGEAFSSYEDASAWAEAMIAERQSWYV